MGFRGFGVPGLGLKGLGLRVNDFNFGCDGRWPLIGLIVDADLFVVSSLQAEPFGFKS